MKAGYKNRILPVIAIATGLVITWIDSGPGWDDTGITVAMIFFATGLFGFISPKRPWLWALLTTVWIPLIEIISAGSYPAIIAIVIGFTGAYSGSFVKRNLAGQIG